LRVLSALDSFRVHRATSLPRSWEEMNREVREAREVIGRLEELAEKAGREGGKIMIAFYTGQISCQEALEKLEALAGERGWALPQDRGLRQLQGARGDGGGGHPAAPGST